MAEDPETLGNRFHNDLFEKGDLAAAEEILAGDFVIHGAGLPPELTTGPEGAKRYAQAIRTGFGGDVNISHDDVIVHGDRVVIRWTARGTHDGDLLGVPATGRPIKVTGIDIFRVKDGKLAELWQNWTSCRCCSKPEPYQNRSQRRLRNLIWRVSARTGVHRALRRKRAPVARVREALPEPSFRRTLPGMLKRRPSELAVLHATRRRAIHTREQSSKEH